MSKRWVVADPIQKEKQDKFPEINPVILQLLWNRGIRTQEEIDVFLGPDYSRDVYDPFLFNHIKEAVNRLFAAIEKDEVITIHGDYDADGVCGTALLYVTIKEIREKISGKDSRKARHGRASCHANDSPIGTCSHLNIYIPHREKEGYGLSVSTVEHLKEKHGTDLIVTVDCGISNVDAIARAKELGIDTIVCDHHDIPKTLPDAILIHPKLPNETYPNKDLSGTGVAFKFATALLEEARSRGADFPKGYEKWLLDLVAIATVTDIMKLTGENRVLEKYGLLVLNKTRRQGLKKLIEIAGLNGKELETWNIGWQIGPRLNAAGRINHATDAFELLTAEDETRAKELAEKLNSENQERQRISESVYWQAVEKIGKVENQKILFAVGEKWPPGIVGLAAGKLCSEHYRPTFVISRDGDQFVGSGRSTKELNITKALQAASEHLDRFGGHPQACGFSVKGEERLAKAIELMTEFAEKELAEQDLAPSLKIDVEISAADIDWQLVDDLEKFRPYGQGNEKPVFLSQKMQVIAAEQIGSAGQHLRLTANPQKGEKMVKLIGFRLGSRAEKLMFGDLIDVVYEIGVNEWNGNREIQLRIVDLRMSNDKC